VADVALDTEESVAAPVPDAVTLEAPAADGVALDAPAPGAAAPDASGERVREFRHALVKTAPLLLGVIPFGLAYGVVATQAGLTVAETVLMSLLVFAGASQFMAVVMIQAGTGMPLIVISTLLINLRHLLMGLSLSPYLSEQHPRWHRLLAFGLVDETYLTTITHYRESGLEQGSPWFMLSSAGLFYCTWATASLIGAIAGHSIPDPMKWGLDFAMPASFITMLLPQIVSKRIAIVVAVAAVTATLGYLYVPGKWYILIGALAAVAVGVALETAEERKVAA
jgi:4-azaleucine resistance transporter AzlC